MDDERRVLDLLRAVDATATPMEVPRDLDPVWQTITTRIDRGDIPDIPDVDLDLERGHREEPAMKTATATTEQGRAGDRRLPVAAVAAGVVVVVAALAVWLAARDTSPDVVVDSSGIPNIIRQSVAALEAGDYDAWRSLHSEGAVLRDGYPVVEDSPLARVFARGAELDLEVSLIGCRETTTPPGSTVRSFRCQMRGADAIMRAAGLMGEARWAYAIEDGQIIESSPPFFDNGAEIAQVHNALVKYLRQVDRATLDETCNGGDLDFFDPQIGPDCTRFIQQHLDGFADSQPA